MSEVFQDWKQCFEYLLELQKISALLKLKPLRSQHKLGVCIKIRNEQSGLEDERQQVQI